MGKGRRHAVAIAIVYAWLIRTFGELYVHQEAPIDVAPEDNPTSEPEPDLIVLSRSLREFKANPRPTGLRLVVEISDSTVGFDLTKKAALYARAGVRGADCTRDGVRAGDPSSGKRLASVL